MLLSIVIPHYNLPKPMLTRCVASIIKQEIPEEKYEIIVVDDGSAEPPLWLSSIFKSSNIRVIAAEHGGPGAARNRGMEEAAGKYIMFADADDYLITNGEIHHCLSKLEEEESPDILRYRYIVSTDKKYPKVKKIKFGKTVSGAEYMAKNNLPGSPCCYFFKRELAANKGIKFPANIFHEDEEFNTILHYHAATLTECNAYLYLYCIREGSTTANSSAKFEEARLDNLFHIIERLVYFRSSFSEHATPMQKKAIDRKLNTLATDAMLNLFYAGKSAPEIWEACKARLSPLSLYPIPAASYSIKYCIFRLLANNKYGLKLLRKRIPAHKPAKK